MKRYGWALLVVLFALVRLPVPARADSLPSANEILVKIDEYRAPRVAYECTAILRTFKDGKVVETLEHNITVGNDSTKTLVRTLSPANQKGRIFLASGDDMWVLFPRTTKPVRISAEQRLVGQVSNGDLARILFAHDYSGKERQVDGTAIKLALEAKSSGATYGKATLWVEPGTFRPLHADFYGRSGKLLKQINYTGWQQVLGHNRATKSEIKDPVHPSEMSTIEYVNFRAKPTDASNFDPDYLRHLR